MAKTETANYIKVTQVKSAIGRIEPQKRTIKALGLGKISSSSVLPDNPAVRGMVNSVAHLIKVEAAEKPARQSLWKTKPQKTVKAEVKAESKKSDGKDQVPPDVKPVAKKAVAAKVPAAKKAPSAKATEAKPAAAKKPAPKPSSAKATAAKKETK